MTILDLPGAVRNALRIDDNGHRRLCSGVTESYLQGLSAMTAEAAVAAVHRDAHDMDTMAYAHYVADGQHVAVR